MIKARYLFSYCKYLLFPNCWLIMLAIDSLVSQSAYNFSKMKCYKDQDYLVSVKPGAKSCDIDCLQTKSETYLQVVKLLEFIQECVSIDVDVLSVNEHSKLYALIADGLTVILMRELMPNKTPGRIHILSTYSRVLPKRPYMMQAVSNITYTWSVLISV